MDREGTFLRKLSAGGLSQELLVWLQVQIEIETMDRGGTFLGKLTLSGPRGSTWDLGLSLLEAGLGKLHPSFDADRVAGGRALQQAQDKAQGERLKVRSLQDRGP